MEAFLRNMRLALETDPSWRECAELVHEITYRIPSREGKCQDLGVGAVTQDMPSKNRP